jgi:hypothetical protein
LHSFYFHNFSLAVWDIFLRNIGLQFSSLIGCRSSKGC